MWKQVTIVVDETMLTDYGDKIVLKTSNATAVSGFSLVRSFYIWVDDISITAIAD